VISDLLANLYLIDYDKAINDLVITLGGVYYRYSDDILIIAPVNEERGKSVMEYARSLIGTYGKKLTIKEEKSSMFIFKRYKYYQKFKETPKPACCTEDSVLKEKKVKKKIKTFTGLEYLGFRYDGKHIFIRDKTLSNLYRKVTKTIRRRAEACARSYPDKDVVQLKELFNYEEIIKKHGKVEDFSDKQEKFENWTFWTYARRSAEIMGPLGRPIVRQLRGYRSFVHWRVELELERAVRLREKRRRVLEIYSSTAT
jgi:hypothetical protein